MHLSGTITSVLNGAISTRAPVRNPTVPCANLRMLRRLNDVEFIQSSRVYVKIVGVILYG
jgi:hypothetical protein